MAFRFFVTTVTGIVFVTALETDRDHVFGEVIVKAPGLEVDRLAENEFIKHVDRGFQGTQGR